MLCMYVYRRREREYVMILRLYIYNLHRHGMYIFYILKNYIRIPINSIRDRVSGGA